MAKTILRAGDREYVVEISESDVTVDGTSVTPPPRAHAVAEGDTRWVFLDGEVFAFEIQKGSAQGGRRRKGRHHHGSLSAPMPATVVRVNTETGASVKRGDTLIVLEAMKMELPIRATEDGTVTAVNCRVGELVQPGAPLVEIDT